MWINCDDAMWLLLLLLSHIYQVQELFHVKKKVKKDFFVKKKNRPTITSAIFISLYWPFLQYLISCYYNHHIHVPLLYVPPQVDYDTFSQRF